MPDPSAAATKTSPSLDAFIQVEKQLNSELVEREREIHAIQVALVAGANCFLLGPPGTAKSLTIERHAAYISGVRYFSLLMTKMTVLDEVFGPVSLKGLEEDRYARILTGYLAEAELAFLDEIWKSNSAALNALLWATNERKARNDGKIINLPLSSMFCASNELPESEALNAIYDRIEVRLEVNPVRDPGNQRRVLQMGGKLPEATPILTWNDVVDMKQQAEAVLVGDGVLDKMIELRRALREEGIEPTERRWAKSVPLLRAEAALDGCTEVEIEHLAFLTNVLWDRPEQIADVETIVLGLANPLQKKALDMLQGIEGLSAEVESIVARGEDEDMTGSAMEIQRKIKKVNKSLESLESDVGQSRRQQETVAHCRQRLYDVTVRLLTEVFNLSPDAVKSMIEQNK